jgi:hypothetical protein
VPLRLDRNPFTTVDEDAEDDDDEFFTPNFADRKFFSTFTPTFGPTIRPNGHRIFGRFSSSHSTTTKRPSYDQAVLGSGDFTVMRGGSFYADGDARPTRHDFFSGSSTNGRPYALPLESSQPHIPDDPFASFRDFADITGSAIEESDFSHHVEVYTKKEPNNILDELQAIDDEKEQEVKKLSKFKSKLSSTLKMKPKKKKSTKISSSSLEPTDPLVAES